MKKVHPQFCALARSLDLIGDRWTLLIVRELLPGPRGFRQIRAKLPGIASNLLAARLKGMREEGLVTEIDRGSGKAGYALSDAGLELREAVEALVRWGGPRLPLGSPDRQTTDPRWLLVALPAVLKEWKTAPLTEIALSVEGLNLLMQADPTSGFILKAGVSTGTPLHLELDYISCLALFGGTKIQRAAVLARASISGKAQEKSAFQRWIRSGKSGET